MCGRILMLVFEELPPSGVELWHLLNVSLVGIWLYSQVHPIGYVHMGADFRAL